MEERDLPIEILKTLKELMKSMTRLFKAELGTMGLTPPQAMAIGLLAEQGEMKISDISSQLKLSGSTVSGIVDRLEKQGFVERIRSETDRRVVNIRAKVEKCRYPEIEEKVHRVFRQSMSVYDKRTLENILSVLMDLNNTFSESVNPDKEKPSC